MFKKKTPPILSSLDFSKIQPLHSAFAHNDQEYNFPLLSALNLGFNYVEADIHLIKNEIYVSHRKPFFKKNNNTLTNLYLDPLFKIFNSNDNRIFNNSEKNFHLILDIKTESDSTYSILKEKLEPFNQMISHWENQNENRNAISIHLSGNRPMELVSQERKRSVLLDGRIKDLDKKYDPNLMPLISENYSKIFGRSFFSKKPSREKLKRFQKISNEIHQQDKQFRLWNIPENENVWTLLLENGLDIISTNKIEKLESFLKKQ